MQCGPVLELPNLMPGFPPDAIWAPLLTLKALQNLAQTEYFISHASHHLYSFPDPHPLQLREGIKQDDDLARTMG